MKNKENDWVFLTSTRVRKAKYNIKTQTVTVEFTDGIEWNYYMISPLEWTEFITSDSPGKYLYDVLDQKPNGG